MKNTDKTKGWLRIGLFMVLIFGTHLFGASSIDTSSIENLGSEGVTIVTKVYLGILAVIIVGGGVSILLWRQHAKAIILAVLGSIAFVVIGKQVLTYTTSLIS